MLDFAQLSQLIIKPALVDLNMYSEDAEWLLLFTVAVESDGGTYLKQIKGPALGIYQMEPETYNDIWQNYLRSKTSIMLMLVSSFDVIRMPSEDRLIYDLRFATAMARIHYYRVKEKLPPAHNIDELWDYYKKYYNTKKGDAQKEESLAKFHAYLKS